MEAVQDSFDEAIALDHYGYVSEGSGENVFIVKNGVVFTPPTSSAILAGITRHSIFVLARDMGLEIRQQVLPREGLYIADEVFLSGTRRRKSRRSPGLTISSSATAKGALSPKKSRKPSLISSRERLPTDLIG